MLKLKRHYLLVILSLLICKSIIAQPAIDPQTYCNPLNLNYRFMADAIDAREAADAVIVLFQDDYYLFASRSGGYWTSTDLRSWELIVPTGIDIETYAPGVVAMRDSLFYVPSATSQIYVTHDPKSGIWQEGPTCNSYGDPAFFLDDDDRLYMCYGLSNSAPTRIVELDPYTFEEISDRVTIVYNNADIHGWERRGDDNLLDEFPWIEGTWMVKENGKYYYHYAAPGTEFKTYADGIYVADSPLGPYEYAEYSPFSFKPSGFIAGAGHGSTFKDKDGKYWHIGTMTISVKAMFERRLGLSPVSFDEDGHIYCNTAWGDYPQYLPGVQENHIDNFAGMLLLSHKKYTAASSSLEDHDIEYAVDEDARTYWSAQTGGTNEWMIIDLGDTCNIEAIQVNFAEHNTNPDMVRGRDNIIYQQYTIEKSLDGLNWDMLVDKSQNMLDVPHDYIELAMPSSARYIKLTNVFTPGNGTFAIRGLRIFGNSEQAVFTPVEDFTVQRDAGDGRDAILRWDPVVDADGYLIRFGIAADKLYNHFIVYDTDSVALHCLNHGVDYYYSVEAFDNGTDYYSPIGEIRSSENGDWNNLNTWERFNGTSWVHPSPNIPSYTDGIVTIREGHTVTVTANDTIDQLTVVSGGSLVVNAGITLHLADGIGTDLSVEGTVTNYGSITQDSTATSSFSNGGTYQHEQDGGTIPSIIWRIGSTCVIDDITTTVPANLNQDFYDLNWNCPDQTANLSMSWNENVIGGDITISSTGTGTLQMCAPAAAESSIVTINGDIIQSGGQFTSNNTSNGNTTIIINHDGNIDVTGGNFSISRGSQDGTGTTSWNLTNGNVSLQDATTQNANSSGATFVFTKEGTQTLTFSDVTFAAGGFPAEVDSGTSLNMGTSVLEGDGNFLLKSGATLLTAHESGINGSIANTGTRTLEKETSYGFNGSVAQVTGILMPDTVNTLIIDNSAGVTLSKSVVVTGIMELDAGILSAAGNTLTYGENAALKYAGASAQVTTDAEFLATDGPKALIIANPNGVTLHATRTIEELELDDGILNLGGNTLIANSATNASETEYVVTDSTGFLTLKSVGASQVYFPIGTESFAPVWITNSGTVDDISLQVIEDTEKAPYGGRVKAKWNIIENETGGGNYTIQFGWMTKMEEVDFRRDRENHSHIFHYPVLTEAGSGEYTMYFATQPHTLSRGGIETLGEFVIGMFEDFTGIMKLDDVLPTSYTLSQNFPNPFNPVTTIKFDIAKPCQVKIVIYDILGKKIDTLLNDRLNTGRYSLQWNGTNQASGIYIYKLMTKDFVKVKKMLLLK